MLRSLLFESRTLILRRPVAVLLGCALVSLVAAWLGAGVELRSSRAELAPAGDPDQRRFDALLAEFRATEVVIAAVAIDDADLTAAAAVPLLREAADRLAAALAADPSIERVYHRLDLSWFAEHAPWLAPPDALEELADRVERESDTLRELLERPGLDRFNDLLAARLESASTAAAPAAAGAGEVELLRGALELQRRWLEEPERLLELLARSPAVERLAAASDPRLADPYLVTSDGRMLLLVITPREAADSRQGRRETIAGIQRVARDVLGGDSRLRVGLAGTTAMAVEEMAFVGRDTRRGALVAVVGVALLTMLVFRWRSHALLVLAALGLGVLWSLGAVRLEYGYLNLITSAFVSTLIGVGVAYGIHPMSEYELLGAHGDDPDAAVAEAFRRTGPAVAAAALTTSAAFFSILLMQFRGFAELGLVAGVGVLLCLAAALVALPAMMVLHGRWLAGRERDGKAGPRRAAIDAVWGDRATDWICRRPRTVVVVAAVLGLAGALGAIGLRFDTDLMRLLPDESESVRIQRALIADSALSPVFNLAVVDSLDELRTIRARAAAEPSIARVESVLELMPAAPRRSAAALERLRVALRDLAPAGGATQLTQAALGASVARLESALADAGDAAFVAGLGALAGPLEAARVEAENCRSLVGRATAAEVARWNEAQRHAWGWLREGLVSISAAIEAGPYDVNALPDGLRGRLVTSRGRFAAYLHPQGNALDPARLDEYVDATLRVAPGAIGFPFMFRKMSRLVWNGFRVAVLVGALLVALILWLDLRRVDETLLALVPLALGILWMLGGMRLVGIDFNFANLVALPLVIGVGIDNGVHVMHRLRLEGAGGMALVLRHTGRAILIASLTTMIGFGSLALASHRGLAGLGTVLLLGVGSCLVTSTVVLPNLLIVMGRVRR